MADNYPVLTLARKAASAILPYRIVKPTDVDGEVAVATDGADPILAISTSQTAAEGDTVEVNYEGIVPVVYGETIEAGEPLTAGAAGVAMVAGPGDHIIGRANESGAAGAVGSVVMAPAVVDEANTATQTHLTKNTHRIPVPLTSFHLVAGTPLAAFADGDSVTPGLVVDDNEAPGIRWNNHATPAAVYASVPLPVELNEAADVQVNVVASKTGATLADATTFTVGAFFPAIGAARDADANAGGATAAMVGNATTKTVQSVARAIANADIPAPTAAPFMTLSLKPTDGTLGADDVTVHAVYLTYTPKILT